MLPGEPAQVSPVLAYCHSQGLKVVARGSGTSLSGGASPLSDAIVLGLGKLNRVLEIDYANRCVIAQPGVTNLAIIQAVAERWFYHAPDPSSQIACSIGGNVAENSGGVHCLKYGMTTSNVLGVEMVLIDGSITRLGARVYDAPGYDALGIVTGSEGLLGVIAEVTARILPRPEHQQALLIGFPSIEAAGSCVAATIGRGLIASGAEMPTAHTVELLDWAGGGPLPENLRSRS